MAAQLLSLVRVHSESNSDRDCSWRSLSSSLAPGPAANSAGSPLSAPDDAAEVDGSAGAAGRSSDGGMQREAEPADQGVRERERHGGTDLVVRGRREAVLVIGGLFNKVE